MDTWNMFKFVFFLYTYIFLYIFLKIKFTLDFFSEKIDLVYQ